MRHQRLVRSDDMLPGGERRLYQLARHPVRSADQLNHDVYVWYRGELQGIRAPAHRRQIGAAIGLAIARRHRGDDDRPPRPHREPLRVALEQLQRPGANRAETGDGDFERRLHPVAPTAGVSNCTSIRPGGAAGVDGAAWVWICFAGIPAPFSALAMSWARSSAARKLLSCSALP